MSNNIPIKNIYYILSYVYQNLNQDCYKNIQTENFDNATDMFAAILIKGIEQQVKRYLNREYVQGKDSLSVLRGKIEIKDSINEMSFLKKRLICSYDEFSIDSYMNRILKSCMIVLIRSESVRHEYRQKIKGLLGYFSTVKEIDLHHINWKLQFNKNNQNYRLLMDICYLLIHSQLQSRNQGNTKIMNFYDDQEDFMHNLYEKFIFAYYKKEYGNDITLNAHMIIEYGDKAWVLYAGNHNILTETYANYNTYFEHIKYCKEKGIKLVRIRYDEQITFEVMTESRDKAIILLKQI